MTQRDQHSTGDADINPYAPPQADAAFSTFARQAVLLIVACVVIFSLLGAAIALAVNAIAPSYYEWVAASGDNPGLSPVQVALGLGATQGAGGGGVIGLALVALYQWLHRRPQTF